MDILPEYVITNEEFEFFEDDKNTIRVLKYNLLVRSIEFNHIICKTGCCIKCCQDKQYLVYTHQIECFNCINLN